MKAQITTVWPGQAYRLLRDTEQFEGGAAGWGYAMIDWDRVNELRSEFGEDGFAEVAGLFLEEADEVVDQLGLGLPANQVESRLHFLKGSALNLGLTDLAALCHEGECKAAKAEGATVDLVRIVACYAASRSAFQQGAGRAAA